MKKKIYIFLLLGLNLSNISGQQETLSSPDENIKINITIGECLYYQVLYKDEVVLQTSPLSITINNNILGKKPLLTNVKRNQYNNVIKTVWGSRSEIEDNYKELILDFAGNFSVQFRAYNNGVAYRFVTRLGNKKVIVGDEEVAFRFNFGTQAWVSESQNYETRYKEVNLDVEKINEFGNAMDKLYLPVVVQANTKTKMMISESNLHDYPSLFLNRGNDYENYLLGTFEKVALSTKIGGFSNYSYITDNEAGYIAHTDGNRSYP